jgi:hypothetical protein
MHALILNIDGIVGPERLKVRKITTLSFIHKTLKEMLDHFQASSTKVDDDDVSDLITSWEVSENSATKLARDDKIQQQLLKKGISSQPLF